MFFAKNALSDTFVMMYLPSFVMTITSSMSEQSQTNSSLRIAAPIPKNPSSRLTFATTTFVASIESKLRSSVFRSQFLPYLSRIRVK